jgi:hypothetical protein
MPQPPLSTSTIWKLLHRCAADNFNKAQTARELRIARSSATKYIDAYKRSSLPLSEINRMPRAKLIDALFPKSKSPTPSHRRLRLPPQRRNGGACRHASTARACGGGGRPHDHGPGSGSDHTQWRRRGRLRGQRWHQPAGRRLRPRRRRAIVAVVVDRPHAVPPCARPDQRTATVERSSPRRLFHRSGTKSSNPSSSTCRRKCRHRQSSFMRTGSSL